MPSTRRASSSDVTLTLGVKSIETDYQLHIGARPDPVNGRGASWQ